MTKQARRFWFLAARFVLVAITLALCPALACAQSKSDAGQTISKPVPDAATSSNSLGPANEQSAFELITLVLKLNDSQQEQLHAAFNAALKEATPVAGEMAHRKNTLFAAARSGKSEDEIERLAEEQGKLTSRMLVLQARTFAKLWALLDNRQKGLADDFVYSNIRLFLPADPQ